MKKCLIIPLCLLLIGGCTAMYPRFLDDPQVKVAMIEAFKDGVKTMSANANVSNPEMEFYYKVSVGGRVIGVTANVQGTVSSGEQPTTQPSQ